MNRIGDIRYLIKSRRPGMIIVDKRVCISLVVDFAIPYDSRVGIKENEKIEKYQDLARDRAEIKVVRYESESDTYSNWCLRKNTKSLGRKAGKNWN